mmetsp:Transcript_32028/g.73811  ORF Transcript_32028/g.73811 Transcript_32028/m.73811 type:complete len:111 (+) Transcript_32028:65-397(+)
MPEDFDSSFDSKEDHELYQKLMWERTRLQHKAEEKRRETKALRSRQASQNLEERERGFQLHFAGANEQRLVEAKRRQMQPSQEAGPRSEGLHSGKEWQVQTIELRGKDEA